MTFKYTILNVNVLVQEHLLPNPCFEMFLKEWNDFFVKDRMSCCVTIATKEINMIDVLHFGGEHVCFERNEIKLWMEINHSSHCIYFSITCNMM